MGHRHLRRRIIAASAKALENGALVPIATEREVLVDGPIAFQVRVAANLRRKDEQSRARSGALPKGAVGERTNPFLPYDEALYVADVGAHHVGLLNKFNVMDHHLLLVTRAFEDQRNLLTQADFAALWSCLREIDGLGFYNGGAEAGASQSHKHLQLVMLPFTDAGPRMPMEPALELATLGEGSMVSASLGFPHALARLKKADLDPGADVHGVAQRLHERYLALLGQVGLAVAAGQQRQPAPYNLLMTRQWMLVVPRAREHFAGVSLNGLAFAGSLFVRDRAQLRTLREAGPMRVLGEVTRAHHA